MFITSSALSASADNTLLDLHNSSGDTHPHSIIIKYLYLFQKLNVHVLRRFHLLNKMEELYPPVRVVRIIMLEVSVTSVRVISYSVLDCVIIGDYLSSGKLICNRLPGIKRMLSIPQIRRLVPLATQSLICWLMWKGCEGCKHQIG